VSEIAVIPTGQLALFDLAAIANREHQLALEAGAEMIWHWVRAGEALIKAKAQLRHGEWLPWLTANFEPSEWTARRYMLIASNRARVPDLIEPTQRKALEAFGVRSEQERPTIERPAPPAGTYDLVYADPPWRYDAPGGDTPELRAVERHYPTMTLEEIKALPVPAAPDAACFLWVTNPLLREALEVLEAWDFTYRTNLVWVKDRIGMGYWVRGQHELLLIGRRGNIATPAESLRPPSVLHAPRLEHSAKPEAVYGLLESMYPTATRIELFARSQRPGWDTWGALAA
jgi:N6-adenosine-specific RNA methylase IME4